MKCKNVFGLYIRHWLSNIISTITKTKQSINWVLSAWDFLTITYKVNLRCWNQFYWLQTTKLSKINYVSQYYVGFVAFEVSVLANQSISTWDKKSLLSKTTAKSLTTIRVEKLPNKFKHLVFQIGLFSVEQRKRWHFKKSFWLWRWACSNEGVDCEENSQKIDNIFKTHFLQYSIFVS